MKISPALLFAGLWSLLVGFTRAAEPAAGSRSAPMTTDTRDEVLVIIGAPGEDTFAPGFTTAAKNWQAACDRAHVTCTVIGLDDKKDPAAAPTDRDRVQDWLKKLHPGSAGNVWIAYVGHGTFDGRDARMNLRGPDILPADLAAWLKPVTRPVIFIHGGSASYPFLTALSAPNRIIITATRAGQELSYTRFGERFAEAVASDDADLDQDGQVSLLEAFVFAAQKVQGFYHDETRMLSEHATLDDNGDKNGTQADFYKGTRVVKQFQAPRGGGPTPTVDGKRARLVTLAPSDVERAMSAAQLGQREKLEVQLERLRAQKTALGDVAYYAQLEALLRQLAALYAPAPDAPAPTAPDSQPPTKPSP